MDLTDEDVAEVLALLDSLPYDELDLQTPRFRLTLRRTPQGWTRTEQVLSAPEVLAPVACPPEPSSRPPEPSSRPPEPAADPGPLDPGPLEPGPPETAGPPETGPPATAPVSPQATAPVSPQATAPVSPQATAPVSPQATAPMSQRGGYSRTDVTSLRPGGGEAEVDEAEEAEGTEGLVAVRAPLPGTFYRAPRPGAAPFVEVGSRVSADTVVGIVETMKLMTSVPAGADGTVAEICLANAEPTAQGATLMRIRADP
jgi:acetyl-CoA carboxylase biotin carboxyl carrier protein